MLSLYSLDLTRCVDTYYYACIFVFQYDCILDLPQITLGGKHHHSPGTLCRYAGDVLQRIAACRACRRLPGPGSPLEAAVLGLGNGGPCAGDHEFSVELFSRLCQV